VTRGSKNNRLKEIASNWRPRRRRANRFKGQSMVELALALPTLLLLLLGTIDIGRVFTGYIEMRNGAFEGARYGARVPTDTMGITNAVIDHGVPSNTSVSVTTDPTTVTLGTDATITVVVTHTFTPITTGFLNKFFGIGEFHLRATATMQVMT
jgi:Flp pilus assembly protein TadG